MKDFDFKELDEEGLETLEAIASADRFNDWMYQTIKPYCKGNILEIGSGIGNISQFFLADNQAISLSDIRENYRAALSKRFDEKKPPVLDLDIVVPDFEERHKGLLGTYDTVFALNVVEHIEDDSLAIRNCKKLLKPGGHIVILVPSYQLLYNNFDKALYHFRRYNAKTLRAIIAPEFNIIHEQYFNLAGIAGWVLTGSILRKKTIPAGQMGLYNKLVPIFKVVDKVMFNKVGLSTIAVGRKE